MNLFIIGNGFDLAHNLPTQYMNFREYLEEKDWNFLMMLEETYGFCSDSNVEALKEYLWQNFESNLSNIDETGILENGEHISLGLEDDNYGVEDTLDEYWEKQYGYIKDLDKYLKRWINSIDIKVNRKTNYITEENNDLFITFNYTLLLEKIYDIDSYDILHIHGSVDDKDISPIIGHGDYKKIEDMKARALEYAEMSLEKETSIYNAVRNFYERTFKDVKHCIWWNENFFVRLKEIEQVFVIGHSFGDVDLPYFEEIFSNVSQQTVWNVFYCKPEEECIFKDKLIKIGIKKENIKVYHASLFFNI